ncbi:helix-turn-helix transcriptional regulator [Streptomyces violaceoruber]|uniref:AAA family ATPase n=1 Tax=Streptomyces violaceoruber TaxID=1935 RepID=A0ACD4WNW8_STRVN|nr:AAA family ATPase [Streptomyces violaceoruber]BDD73774.1 transcriptional regulator [Streptomyces coelicolor]
MTGPLRERDDAHALLSAEIERARAGSGRLVLLRGASGTGRTAVLETAARHAEDRGLRVLRVRCSPEDTSVPFAMVLHLLGPVPEFTDTAPGGDDRGSAARLWRLLRSYAAEGPVLLAVDDVHLADDSSRRWLTEAARHVDRLPVLLVATERSQYDVDPRPAGLTQALSPSLVRTHTLAPLSDSAAAALVREAFPDASARWTEECVRAGAGSPLLLHALLDDLGGTPHPDGVPPVPDSCAALYPGSYPAAVSWWLNSAGPATADVARCLAALEQAWPTGPPDHRAALRHALPRQRAAAPGAAYRQAPPSDGVYREASPLAGGYGQASPWDGADRPASSDAAYPRASAPGAAYRQAPPSDGAYGQAPLSAGGYGQASPWHGADRQASLSDGADRPASSDAAYPRASAPGAAYPQAPPSDGAYGQTQLSAGGYGQASPWHGADRQASLSDSADRQASPFGTADRQASAPDAAYGQAPSSDGVYGQAPLSDGAYGQAPLSDGAYGQAPLDGVYGQAPPSDAAYPQGSVVGAVRRHTHETPTARTRRPRDIAPGCRDVWSADPGGGADPRSPLPGGPGPGAELPEHGPYPHPDELAGPADGVPYPVHGPYDGPYDGRTESAPRAAYGRTGPPAHAPHRTTLWRTPSPPPAQGSAGDPVDVLAEAAGADPARIEGWLAAMTRLGLLRPDEGGRPRYAHPLLRDAVLTGWPRPRREAVHRSAAEAMLRRGDRVEAVARHLLRTPAVGLSWALRVLRDAVTVAVHDARPADAVGYLRRALDEPVSDDLRQRLLTELGSLEYASADTPAAIARLAEAQHLPAEPRNRVRTAVALGTALAGRGEIRTAMEVLRRTEGRLSGHPGLARTVQTATALLSDEDLATRQEVYRWLSETGRHSPELVGTAGQALLVRYAATAALISADEAMARVRDLLAQPTDPLAEPFLLGTAAAVAQWADELDEAERLVERGLAGQHPALLHPMQHALLNTRADIVASRGDHARLLALAADRGPGPGSGPTNRDAHALMALVHTGRTDEALHYADRFDLREVPENWELNRYLYARGVLRAATGDPAGALHDFLECGRRQAAREVISPVVTPWRTAVAECRLALGGGPEALALATEELRLARVWNTPRTVGRALRVLGTATGGRRGLELAEEAVRTLRDAPADTDMELIPALLAQGRQLLGAGERGRARARLREAAELAERKGALRWLTLAGQALREGGARGPVASRTGADALTGSERRIAELAADGRTNTEIADLLHLARRTVETHLTSTYRKLRIRRRTELPAALERGGRREREPRPDARC